MQKTALLPVIIAIALLSGCCSLLSNNEIIDANSSIVSQNATVNEAYAAGNGIRCLMLFSSENASKLGMANAPDRINGTVLIKEGKTRWSLDVLSGGKTIKENSVVDGDYLITEVTDQKIDAMHLNGTQYEKAIGPLKQCKWLQMDKSLLPGELGSFYSAINLITGNMTITQIQKAYSDKGISMQCDYEPISNAAFVTGDYCTYQGILMKVLTGG
jgi:uncharacterized protein YceK